MSEAPLCGLNLVVGDTEGVHAVRTMQKAYARRGLNWSNFEYSF